MSPNTVRPCKRGHIEPRNKAGQCPACLRLSRQAYDDRKLAAAAKGAAAEPAVAATAAPVRTVVVPHSFLAVAREYLATQRAEPATARKHAYFLATLSALHARSMSELTPGEIARALVKIQDTGDRVEVAHRCKAFVHLIAEYAHVQGYSTANVFPRGMRAKAVGLRSLVVESHAAIIDPEQLGRLLRMIDISDELTSSRAQPSVGKALRLAPLVFVRPGELRSMEWAEINFEQAQWVIPGPKMKMKDPHVVPLSTQALAVLREQHERTGTDRYVFRTKRADEPLSENGFREVLRSVLPAAELPDASHTMHGWRATARTRLSKLGYNRELIELQLAHAERSKVVAAYERERHLNNLPERVVMMQAWADYLDQLKAHAAQAVAQKYTPGG